MSYCTSEWADTYLNERAFTSTWTEDIDKTAYLTLATELIRQFCCFQDEQGNMFRYLDDESEEWLKKATAEQALYLVNLGKDPTQADQKTTLGIVSTDGTVFDKSFSADILCVSCRRILEDNGGIIAAEASSGSKVSGGWFTK